MSKSRAANFFWAAFRERVLHSITRWRRTKYRCGLSKFRARPSPTRNMRLLSMIEATSGDSYGMIQEGVGVKAPAQSIRPTGGSSNLHGRDELFTRWLNLALISPPDLSPCHMRLLA